MTERKRCYEEATNWATDTRQREAQSVRNARIIAAIAIGIALLEAIALILLIPLKTVKAVTILVDKQTGFVQSLDPDTPRRVQADAALTASMLAQYVVAREGFDRATISNDYQRVALWSTGRARAQYLALMPATNPESPIQRYAPGAILVAHVKSVSPLSTGTALVRFDTHPEDRAGRAGTAEPWIAVVQYHYSDAAMSFEKRLVNPLGFQVTSYRRDPEAPGTGAAAPQAIASAAGPRPYAIAAAAATAPTMAFPYGLERRGLSPNQIPSGSPLRPVAPYGMQALPMAQR